MQLQSIEFHRAQKLVFFDGKAAHLSDLEAKIFVAAFEGRPLKNVANNYTTPVGRIRAKLKKIGVETVIITLGKEGYLWNPQLFCRFV